MAFGKDRERVGKMNLRQQLRRGAKKAPKSGGGGGGAYFHNKYQPPTAGPADLIRIIPGSYPTPRVDFEAKDFMRDENGEVIYDNLTYIKYVSYYHATKERSCIGSEGPLGEFKGKGDPCLAKDWFWWEWRQRQKTVDKKKPNSIGRREQFALTVLVMAPFYKVPQMDRTTGQPKINPNTKEPYFEWMKGSKRGNDEFAAAGYERKEGHLMHWSLGRAHWEILTGYGDTLAQHCRSCNSRDCIEMVALICQNCGDSVVEMDTTTLADEDIEKMKNEEVMCPHCNYFGYLEDVIRCTQCSNGESATLFDCDLEVKRVETSKTEGGNQTALQIIRAIGPKPIDTMYGEDLRKPLDLPKIFAPTPMDKQLELFGPLPADDASPTGRQPSNSGTRPYGS